jgi:hypothetical protein
MPTLKLKDVVEYEEKARKLQAKLLMMFDDEIHSLPKDGFERLTCVSRYAAVFGRLWQFFTKQGLVMKEAVQQNGGMVEIDEDVPIEKLQELMAVPLVPSRDRNLDGRQIMEVRIDHAQPLKDMIGQINIGTREIPIQPTIETPEPDFYEDTDNKDEDEG